MLVLLPPSETKRAGGTGSLEPETLYEAAVLGDARARARAALEALSRDPEAAAGSLKLGVKNRDEIQHNLRLGESGTLPAIERYTGVLYDALDVETLAPEAREWVDAHVLVQSALFGLITASDRIPAYRVSAGSRLPMLGMPLKRLWQQTHAGVDWSGRGVVLDLRSKDYAALAPLPASVGHVLQVSQRGSDGVVRALNHFNKAAKGDFVRRLARSRSQIDAVDDLVAWAGSEGLELSVTTPGNDLTLVTTLGASRATG